MTPEERQMLGGLFQRVNSAAATQRDPEAESFINDAVRAAPHSPYVLAQTVLVQQQALEAAANRISQLEAVAQQGAGQSEDHGSFLGNLGKSIFGGGPSSPRRGRTLIRRPISGRRPRRRAATLPGLKRLSSAAPAGLSTTARPMGPASAASTSGGGGGFLQNAASTATGVAGGVVLGNLLGGLFGGHRSGGGLFGGEEAPPG